MINKEHLTKAGLDTEKAGQVIELLGTAVAEKLYSEDGYAKAMADIDRAILTHFEVAKNSDEKTTDYFKRAAGEKAAADLEARETELTGEITDLKEKLKAKPGDEKLIKELDDLKAEKAKIPDLIDEKTKEWKDKFETANSELETFKKRTEIEKHMPKFKEDVDPEFLEYKKNAVINKILENKELQTDDGKILVFDPTNYDRPEIKEYLAKELDSVAFKSVSQPGGGAGKEIPGAGGGKGSSDITFEDGATNLDKYNTLKDHLATQDGLSKLDKEYIPKLNELCKEYELTEYVDEKVKSE